MPHLTAFVFTTLLLMIIVSLSFCHVRAQTQDIVKMHFVNPMTSDSTFNVSDSQVGDVFTIQVYIGNVTDMVAWQIRLAYNRTLLQFAAASFPDSCVFKATANKTATPMAEVSDSADNSSDRADLLVIMTSSYSPDNSLQYPVSVNSTALLCELNFTILSKPIFTNIDLVNNASQSSSRIHVVPSYYLPDLVTSVETLNGTHTATGDSALVFDNDSVPEFTVPMIILLTVLATLTPIVTRRRARHPTQWASY